MKKYPERYPLPTPEWRRDIWEALGLLVVTVIIIIVSFATGRGEAEARPQDSRADYLRQVLPYYERQVPSWCFEDMPCWAGSVNDDRSNKELALRY